MVNPDFRSFAISSTNPNSCPLSWVDNSAFGNAEAAAAAGAANAGLAYMPTGRHQMRDAAEPRYPRARRLLG